MSKDESLDDILARVIGNNHKKNDNSKNDMPSFDTQMINEGVAPEFKSESTEFTLKKEFSEKNRNKKDKK